MIQTAITSWPFATMFIALCATLLALRVIRYVRIRDVEDKAYRASQAVVVQRER